MGKTALASRTKTSINFMSPEGIEQILLKEIVTGLKKNKYSRLKQIKSGTRQKTSKNKVFLQSRSTTHPKIGLLLSGLTQKIRFAVKMWFIHKIGVNITQ